jgi:hypothetical protein
MPPPTGLGVAPGLFSDDRRPSTSYSVLRGVSGDENRGAVTEPVTLS